MERPFSQACENNKQAILDALREILRDVSGVLELGSGTGQHARYFGYAVAMISLAGEPGSDMGPQPWGELTAAEQTRNLLDLLAALCDRDRYPRGAGTDPYVPDDDPRCREYLR